MSTISVSNITTANGTEPLTLQTGNTSAGDVVINSTGGLVLASNSTVNVFTVFANSGVVFRPNNALGTAGQILVSNSIGGAFWATNTGPVAVKESVYTSNGTHTKVGNLVSMLVYCIGAGGGGGGATGTATSGGSFGAAGGAGGTAAIRLLNNNEVSVTSNVVIGIGGAGAANSANLGGTGGNTTFAMANGQVINGLGGTGGQGAAPGTSAEGVNGDLNLSGQDGSRGLGNGVALAVSLSGQGGASALGFGGGGGAVRSNANGQPGDIYGGGGGGAARANSAASQIGGAGANGIIWVIEYYTT